jgi:hypothetical protein
MDRYIASMEDLVDPILEEQVLLDYILFGHDQCVSGPMVTDTMTRTSHTASAVNPQLKLVGYSDLQLIGRSFLYKYMAVHADDLAIAMIRPKEFTQLLIDKYKLKLKGTVFITFPVLRDAQDDLETSVYDEVPELIPSDAPPPPGCKVTLTHYVDYMDADLFHNWNTGCSVTGTLHSINVTPSDWYSKCQSTVETSYESETMTACTCEVQVIDLHNCACKTTDPKFVGSYHIPWRM